MDKTMNIKGGIKAVAELRAFMMAELEAVEDETFDYNIIQEMCFGLTLGLGALELLQRQGYKAETDGCRATFFREIKGGN